MNVGTPVKITNGTHKGKKGTIGNNRPANGHQKGKVPVVVGNKNDLYWVRPDWVCENSILKELQPEIVEQLPTETEIKILEFLRERSHNSCISEIAIATALDKALFQIKEPLQNLLSNGFVISPLDNQYLLNKWNQSEQLDSLKESADFAEEPNSLEDLSGSNPSNLTMTQVLSCEITSVTKSSTEISEIITLSPEAPTSTPSGSLAPEPAAQENAPDSATQNQTSGLSPSAASVKEDPATSLLKTLKDLSIEDFERCLEDSEWRAIDGTIRSCYRARKLEQRNLAPDFLQLPTLLALHGKNSRPAGTTVCDRTARKLGIIRDSQLLSIEAMAMISGFPQYWLKCLLGSNLALNLDDSQADSSTDLPSSPNKPRSHSTESNTCIPLLPGKQWLDPSLIILKDGTQSRDVDALYETDVRTVQQYAEAMTEDLWEWERHPLPIAFLSESGKVYASDCHHRVSAAVLAKKKIFVDLRPGELIDAILHSCKSNTAHGLPLRPKDQRKRIELFLDALSKLDEVRSRSLFSTVPNISEIERKNGNWSARVIAKYLKLTESGYRTIINIMSERDMTEKFSHFKEGDWVHPSHWIEGAIASTRYFDKRKGVFVVAEGDCMSEWVHPDNLIMAEKPAVKSTSSIIEWVQPTTVKQELNEQSANLGIPTNGLPGVKRNEGDPSCLSDHTFSVTLRNIELKHSIEDVCATVSGLVGIADYLSDTEIKAIWKAIAPQVKKLGLLEV